MSNKLLHDMEDWGLAMEPGFEFTGDGDIQKISSVLGQSRQNNVLYVGRAGVGKSATLQGIVERRREMIETKGDVKHRLPLHMIDRRFLLLDTNTLFDTNDPQKIENDIKRIFLELSKPGAHVLVIEDANDLLKGIEDNQCQGLISSLVRELKRGNFQCIMMVRDEPAKNRLGDVLSAHSEFAELFSVVEKLPADKEETLEILKNSKAALETHHNGLHITDDANAEIANLTFQYPNLRMYMRAQPDRSLRLREMIASTFVTERQTRPLELDELESRKKTLEERLEKEPGEALKSEIAEVDLEIAGVMSAWQEKAIALGAAYTRKRKTETEIEKLEAELAKATDKFKVNFEREHQREPSEADTVQHKTPEMKDIEKYLRKAGDELKKANEVAISLKQEHNDKLVLDVADVRKYFSTMSGIPVKDLTKDEASKALGLDKRLKDRIFGQDDAVDTVSSAIKRAKAGLKSGKQPIGSFVCVGSSGTGKSFLAECLAADLFDDPEALTVFDMSEYMERHNLSRLIGSSPGLVGYGEGGALTNAVRKKPHQVILLDEVEKAHADVFKILLQVLDKGRLSDELGAVDFRNTLILMTTNLGQKFSFDPDRTSENSEAEIKGEVRKIFPQELLNRVDGFLLFKALQEGTIKKILEKKVKDINSGIAEKGVSVALAPEDYDQLVENRYVPEEGARQILKFLDKKLAGPIADVVLQHSGNSAGGAIMADYDPETNAFKFLFQPGNDNGNAASSPAPSRKAGGGGISVSGISSIRLAFDELRP